MLDKRQYHFECLRRRRAGWHVKADGMGRLSELMRAAGCFFDRRETEWLAPTQAVWDALRELRLMLDTLAAPPPPSNTAAHRNAPVPSRVCHRCGYECPRHGTHVCGKGPEESVQYTNGGRA